MINTPQKKHAPLFSFSREILLTLFLAIIIMVFVAEERVIAYDSSENMIERIDTLPAIYELVKKQTFFPFPSWHYWIYYFTPLLIDKYYVWPFGTHFHAFHQDKNQGAFAAILKDTWDGSTSIFAWGDPASGSRAPSLLHNEDQVTAIATSKNSFYALINEGKSSIVWGNNTQPRFNSVLEYHKSNASMFKGSVAITGVVSQDNIFFLLSNTGTAAENIGNIQKTSLAAKLTDSIQNFFKNGANSVELFFIGSYFSYCWGYNSNGDISIRIPMNNVLASFMPKEAESYIYEEKDPDAYLFYSKKLVKFAATKSSFAKLFDNGSVSCYKAFATDPEKLEFPYGCNVTSITSTDSAYAAILDNGDISCWGDSGRGGVTPELPKKFIDAAESIIMGHYKYFIVASISSTKRAFAAISSEGKVFCWGDSKYGGETPVLPKGRKVISIASTDRAFAALLDNGSIFCWGDKKYGGLFPELKTQVVSNGLIVEKKNTKRAVAIASTSAAFTAVLEDRTVFSWGNPSLGGITPGDLDPRDPTGNIRTPPFPPYKKIIFITGISPFNNELIPEPDTDVTMEYPRDDL
ncbi:MAG: hypothetical protein ACOYK6_06265 [Chthoniobacterales bacterium]